MAAIARVAATPSWKPPALGRVQWGSLGKGLLSLAGAALVLGGIWQLVSTLTGRDLPGPIPSLKVFWAMASNPLYDNGPNDKGIGLQLAASLGRVGIGFGLGTLLALPLGVLVGVSPLARRVLDPIIQVLRPISPLAWFPIGLAALHSSPNATIFAIFICCLWPTVINTAFGVSSVPQAHKNVAHVFRFNRWKMLTKVILPYSLPYIFTGLRLSMGIAWLVIVAGEMLSGSKGIGWFVWDSWNALSLEKVLSAVLIIGLVGFLIDQLFQFAIKRISYTEA